MAQSVDDVGRGQGGGTYEIGRVAMSKKIAENDGAGQKADLGVEEEAPSHQVGEGEVAVATSRMECHGLYAGFVVD